MSWFRNDEKEKKEKRVVVTVINREVGERLDEVANRLEFVTNELERKVARMRKEHEEQNGG